MKKLSKLITLCAAVALVIACAVFSASAAVTPSDATFTTASDCPHCGEVVSWTPITELGSDIVTASGHYIVEAGTTLTYNSTCSIGENASDVAILVAGDIHFTGAGHLRIGNNGTTTTWLIGGGGSITGGNAPGSHYNPSLLGVYANGTLNIIGDITIEGNETETVTANRGGVLNVYSTGSANMYGGTINAFQIDSSLKEKHAGVYVRSGGTFTMYGGTINGSSVENGGAIEITGAESSVAVHGGIIYGGNAYRGCAVYISSGTFTMDNGTIHGGTTTNTGGVFYLAGGSATISGTATIHGGTANYGGVAYINAGSFSVSGGTINGGTANTYGGSLYNKGTLTISGGTINGGTAKSGGVIGINGGTTTISGGTVSGGTATEHGGTIYMHTSSGTLNIQNGAGITGGTAANGGTVYMAAGELIMTGGSVSGGLAKNDGSGSSTGHGGCIYVAAGTANFQGGTVTGGKTQRVKDSNNKYQGGNGGTIYTAGTVNLSGTNITGGTCYIGAAFYVTGSSGTVNMTAGTVISGTASSQGSVAGVYSGGTFNMTGGTVQNNVLGDNSGIRVQGSSKVYLHGNALIKAGAGGRNAFDFVGTSSTPATLVLAGNARVGDLEGSQTGVHNIMFQSYTSGSNTYYPRLRIANNWTGYAAFTDNFGSTATGEFVMATDTKYYGQCGTWDADTLTFTQGGNYDGQYLIHGSADEGDVPVFGEDGKLMLPRAKAVPDGTAIWYRLSDAAADAVSNTTGYAVLYTDDPNPITIASGNTAYVDFNGCSATVTGEGTLKALDSSALDTGAGTGIITFEGVTVDTVTVSPVTGETFITLKDDNTATVHAVTANITSVSIRPGTVGMYYSAKFVCDDAVKAHLNNFGLAVSVAKMPDENFKTDTTTLYTKTEGVNLASGEYNSVLIQNIMAGNLDAANNKARGEMPIYANAYMILTIDGQEITVMATTTSQFSLQTLLQKVNTYWDTFAESAQDSLATQIYDPYIRGFDGDDWKLYNLRIHANGGYTSEEKAILAQRRQTVMDYMRESVSLLWRSDKTLTYTLGNTQRDNGASFTIEAGKLYKGLPYVYAAGTQDSFLEYAAGAPDENGIYTITGIEATALNYESYGGRVGNDCSGAVTNAWSQVSPSLSGSTSSGCSPYFGVVPVGNYNFNPPIDPNTHRVLDTKVVVESNGEQVMYEAYAMLQPADAAYHQEYPSTKGNHIRMVVSVNVVRNPDGTINGTESTITMLEQTRTLTNAGKTETHPVTGETIYLIGGEDRTYSFSKLFSEHYIPVTVAELRDPSPVEDVWVADSVEEDTIENLFTGSITTNYNFDAVRITIYNAKGQIVQQTTGRKHRSYPKEYKMARFLTENPGSMKGTLDLDALDAGNYRCTVTVKLTTDEDYIHTVRDFTFSK